ncbi:MAG: hypothetical protein MI799_07320 [Desulfobacterales bacterium]|nr:hypothetical protein [Desulfobacterales bacterium]
MSSPWGVLVVGVTNGNAFQVSAGLLAAINMVNSCVFFRRSIGLNQAKLNAANAPDGPNGIEPLLLFFVGFATLH